MLKNKKLMFCTSLKKVSFCRILNGNIEEKHVIWNISWERKKIKNNKWDVEWVYDN